MSDSSRHIKTLQDPLFEELCAELADRAAELGGVGDWPAEQLQRCASYGVYRWFVPRTLGGYAWSPRQIAEGYVRLGGACLTTTFVITQWVAAVRRIIAADRPGIGHRLLPSLLDGTSHITVGISHLTTSRRHLGRPVLTASEVRGGYELNGYSPWVTAAPLADHFVIGATLESTEQLLLVVPADLPGIEVGPGQSLVALSASRTDRVNFHKVVVPESGRLAGPEPDVMASLATQHSSGTGGLQTSTLAVALAGAAVGFLEQEAARRPELKDKADELRQQRDRAAADLFHLAEGQPACSPEDLRTRANSLVLRSTQAAMVAARGAGFVEGHPVGRWCREALFFLVWSCPPAVLEANLCELAGMES